MTASATLLLLSVVEYALFCSAVNHDLLSINLLRAALALSGFTALLCVALVALASLAAASCGLLATANSRGDGAGAHASSSLVSAVHRGLSWLVPALLLALAPVLARLTRDAVPQRYDHVDLVARAAGLGIACGLALAAAAVLAWRQPRTRRRGLLAPTLLLLAAATLQVQRDLAPFLSLASSLAASLLIAACLMLAWTPLLGWLACWQPRAARPAAVALVALALAVTIAGLASFEDRDESTSRVVLDASPIASSSARAVQWLADVDSDGSAALLGGGDCREGDPAVGLFQFEIVDNGVDDNCQGGDLAAAALAGLPDVQPRGPLPALPAATGTAVHAPRLVVVLTIDAWRVDRLGALTGRVGLTPNLDALARRALVFRAAYAQGADTDSSVRSLWTSRYPVHFAYREYQFTPAPSVFAVLSSAGWATHAFYASDRPNPVIEQVAGAAEWVRHPLADDGAPSSEAVSQRALRWIDDQPWLDPAHRVLLWVHYFDPHLPYEAHVETAYLGSDTGGRYDQEVAWSDRAAGQLLDGLQRRGLLQEAIVVATSDHGESLFENGPVGGHAFQVYEAILRVPWILAVPGQPARVVDLRVGLIDLVPTLTDLLGIPDPVAREGRSLRPLLRGEPIEDRPVFAHASWRGRDRRALLRGPYKLVRDNTRGTSSLYDLRVDPLEREDLRTRRRDLAADMERALDQWWDARFNNVTVALGKGLSPCAGIALESRMGSASSTEPTLSAAELAAARARCEARLRAIWPASQGRSRSMPGAP